MEFPRVYVRPIIVVCTHVIFVSEVSKTLTSSLFADADVVRILNIVSC